MFITYHANTFNRIHFLKNLLLSFETCNVREDFEWIITDYGSTDGTRDFLSEFSSKNKWLNTIFLNQDEYFNFLQRRHISPQNRRQIIATIFGKSINIARSVSNGDYYIHVADDHQFFRKCDWVSEMFDVMSHRRDSTGIQDITSVLYRGLPLPRIFKPNNETFSESVSESGSKYFIAKHKRYDDYHMMSRHMFERIGKYFEIENETNKDIMDKWRKGEDCINHYLDYLKRTKEMNLRKAFMKFPCAVDLDGVTHHKLNVQNDKLIVPIVDSESFINNFSNLSRPVSSDEILGFCKI